MTVVYRIQTRPVTDEGPDVPSWITEWQPTVAQAVALMEEFVAMGWPTRVSRHDLLTDRASLCTALNRADANFTNFPGEEIRRVDP